VNSRIHNLLDIENDKEGFRKLSERIKEAKGSIRIIIHPFYEYSYPDHDETANYDLSQQRTKYLIEKNLSLNVNEVPPLIIFEGTDHVDDYQDKIAPFLTKSNNETYFVPTYNFNSTPNPLHTHGDDNNETMEVEWKKMNGLLSRLGVTKIVLGGYMMGLSPDRPNENIDYSDYHKQREQKGARNQKYFPKYCVGNAYAYLSKQFDVELSNLAYPDNRAEQISKLEKEL